MSKRTETERNRRAASVWSAVRAVTKRASPVRCGHIAGSVFTCTDCRRYRREERGSE